MRVTRRQLCVISRSTPLPPCHPGAAQKMRQFRWMQFSLSREIFSSKMGGGVVKVNKEHWGRDRVFNMEHLSRS
ncbi:hypothetical protein CEXT_672071 [Caerostris extrusa]|uniref:Uncharacterized protein n=1 Tax=Caerostris extrusa TaxID=172846 RepID=A0AAV4RJC2_CAEEX|nr:hypothetical protein CEXT_672071 [Caerostris extrusa]